MIITYALVALILAVLFYRYLIAPVLTARYVRALLYEESADAPDMIPRLLRAFLPARSVFTAITLPIPEREGEEIAYGNVVVTRAGIFIISRICGGGLIENPQGESVWRFLSNGNVLEFPNPFKEQESPRRLLALYAELAGMEDVKVRTLVVYTDEELRFSHPPSKGVMHISQLYRRMSRLSAAGKLSYKCRRAIISALAEASEE